MSRLPSYSSIVFGFAVAVGVFASPVLAVTYVKVRIPHADEVFVARINNENVAAGTAYISGLGEGFTRGANGSIATFSVDGKSTSAYDINNNGAVVGSYADGSAVAHGFVRSPNGSIVSFDIPGGTRTAASKINDLGVTTGTYITPRSDYHGFIRNVDGSVETFDAGPHGTIPCCIASDSTIAGVYYGGHTHHGFIRTPDGAVTTIDPAGSLDTELIGMNDAGQTTGFYHSAQGVYGFIRDRDGATKRFQLGRYGVVNPIAINNQGVVTGIYVKRTKVSRGFLKYPGQHPTLIDTPYRREISVVPESINDQGAVAGYLSVLKHGVSDNPGFIMFPQ